MDTENLIRMANRIADFFAAMPDPVEAREGVAQHLRKFWEPRMRHELIAHCEAHGAEGLHPLVVAAVDLLRGKTTPA